MNTGERMRRRRKELDYSADFIAEKLGVSRSTIFRYENGDIEKLPINILEPLSEILQTTPAYLMGWTDEANSTFFTNQNNTLNKDDEIIIDDSIRRIHRVKKSLPIKEQNKMDEMMDMILKNFEDKINNDK